ncbi:DUF2262 domain-containing protein [Seonamhaeicola sp.]|uniref:DUF2262 domain-containing protein n=1 Tax=Seonamhaeicola sp. TaxID=1912245 RepID=UPI00260A2F6F|nr:DUF2262 domain-containing protein [Seonamhaeicola sp.]
MISKIKSLFQPTKGDSFIGLIDEDGVGKSSFEGECSMTFGLCAYIKNNNPVETKEAVVHRKIPNMDYTIKGLEPLTIVEFRGEQIDYHGQNRINLLSIVKTESSNAVLEEILQKRLEPVEFKSEVFGSFILDRRSHWFETKAQWKNQQIELFLSGTLADIRGLESTAIKLFIESDKWDEKIKKKIASDLLSLKNESWIDENESPLSEKEFLSKITLESIVIHDEEDFEFWFNDGDIFWGHTISVEGNLNGHLDKAGIHG